MNLARSNIFLKKKYSINIKELNDLYERKIVIIGCGGIGSVLIELLARSNFKNIRVIDNDLVDKSNLERQIFEISDLGDLKVNSIKKRIERINPNLIYEYVSYLVNLNNISNLCGNFDLIVDATDNFETRKIINDFCCSNNKDWIYSGAIRDEIVCALFLSNSNNFERIFPNKVVNESCCEVGVLPSTTFICASVVYNKIIDYFLGNKEEVLIKFKLFENQFHFIKL